MDRGGSGSIRSCTRALRTSTFALKMCAVADPPVQTPSKVWSFGFSMSRLEYTRPNPLVTGRQSFRQGKPGPWVKTERTLSEWRI